MNVVCVLAFAWAGAGIGAEPTGGNGADPPPVPPTLATVDDLAAEVAALKELLAAHGIQVESPPPAAEVAAIETLREAGYDIRPMSEEERLDIARRRQDERLAAERAAEDAELAQRIQAARASLVAAGYVVDRPPAEPPEQVVIEEAPAEPPPPAYSAGQRELLALTQSANRRLSPHPALMASAQRLANYHATTGRWGHSSRSWRGNASENIAHSSRGSAQSLATLWRNSRGHWSNWQSSWNYVGVGYARAANGRLYGVQHFSNAPTGASGSGVALQSRSGTYRRGLFGRIRRRR